MLRVLLVGPDDSTTSLLADRLRGAAGEGEGEAGALDVRIAIGGGGVRLEGVDVAVYRPRFAGRRLAIPDPKDVDAFLAACTLGGPRRVVLISASTATPPRHDHTGYSDEAHAARVGKTRLAAAWLGFEERARSRLGAGRGVELVILRPTTLLAHDSPDYLARLLRAPFAFTVAGFEPTVQWLAPEDFAAAVRAAVLDSREGVYQVVPRGAVPVKSALGLARVPWIAVPFAWHRLARALLAPLGLADSIEQAESLRHVATVSGERLRRDLGFAPSRTSVRAILDLRDRRRHTSKVSVSKAAAGEPWFDDFGMSESYVRAYGRTLFRFLHRVFWRIEVKGLENVPREGAAILIGVHRGFMPWDGVMTLHTIYQAMRRVPRFLIHPTLIKFPFLANYMTKLGGVVACQENADRLLRNGDLLGFYPEGIRGAFTMYKEAYRIGKFGRDEFVRTALRNQVPIVPFLTVGSAEIYPILGKIEWSWWKHYSEWPFLPITPTFPWLPFPLPSKWHTEFLAPIPIDRRYPKEAADDPAIVRAISAEIRTLMQERLLAMKAKRKSIFWGSIFTDEG